MNETFVSLNNRLLLLEDKQMSCFVNMKLWFLIHLFVTLLVQLILTYIYIIIFCISMFFFLFFPNWYRLLDAIVEQNCLQTYDEEQERYLYVIRVLKKEIILIFFYILFNFMYRWFVLMDSIITSANFHQ
jgi:hypothetical protein